MVFETFGWKTNSHNLYLQPTKPPLAKSKDRLLIARLDRMVADALPATAGFSDCSDC